VLTPERITSEAFGAQKNIHSGRLGEELEDYYVIPVGARCLYENWANKEI
jgi:hypothetical protein